MLRRLLQTKHIRNIKTLTRLYTQPTRGQPKPSSNDNNTKRIISKVVYDASTQPGTKKISTSTVPATICFMIGFICLGLWYIVQSKDFRNFLKQKAEEYEREHGLKKQMENRGTSAVELSKEDYVKQVKEILRQVKYSST